MVNQLLTIGLGLLPTPHDKYLHLEELAAETHVTTEEVAKILREGTGLKTKPCRKFGVVKRGYSRVDLILAKDKLDQKRIEPEEGPLEDWVCLECATVFESREEKCPDPECHSTNVKRARIKAPGVKSSLTTRTDAIAKDLVYGSGMTDYNSREQVRPQPKYLGMWASPNAPARPGQVLQEALKDPMINKRDFGAYAEHTAGSTFAMPKSIPGAPGGEPHIVPGSFSGENESHVIKPQRTPTTIVGRDDRPLPL